MSRLQPDYTVSHDEADWVVVGTGAGGATAAWTLAEAGMDVILVEEGPYFPVEERTPVMAETMQRVLRDGGLTTILGRTVLPYLQGCCVGGTTVINGAIVWRLPQDVHSQWLATDPGLAHVHSLEKLESCFERIEQDLGIGPTDPAVAGDANELVRRGCEALGWSGRRINRNERGCRGTGRCLHGCPIGAKQSMEVTYIPWALKRGARLYARARVETIRMQRGRARSVVARRLSAEPEADPTYLELEARCGIVLAAGAVHTPALLTRNRLGGRFAGSNLMCHPGVSMAGRFPQEVRPWSGATQGYEITEHRQQGVKLETLGLAPEYGAMRLPGAGADYVKTMAALNRCVVIGAAVRSSASGRVRPLGAHGVTVRYSPSASDVALAHKGLWAMAEVFRAAGAEAILPSVNGWPGEIGADEAPERIRDHPPHLRDLKMVVTHLLGGASMGTDPSRSVVSPSLAVHGCKNLYVADASVFPTNTGVNPQHTIMAIAMNAARHWIGP